eukprot:CAMPEP_0172055944 /NCGR_PEP_ID=MMETSP1043-20130122/5532_1 /TAXON_ID=464988 /ORGANISM="Hemiselmis andersenii, Strain CCMP441" /LENGTH=295 /DNA_ID=CAMNT_0012715339 /DNA_START=855 /DNA_END=1742 /DNA_ORIENTATION=-
MVRCDGILIKLEPLVEKLPGVPILDLQKKTLEVRLWNLAGKCFIIGFGVNCFGFSVASVITDTPPFSSPALSVLAYFGGQYFVTGVCLLTVIILASTGERWWVDAMLLKLTESFAEPLLITIDGWIDSDQGNPCSGTDTAVGGSAFFPWDGHTLGERLLEQELCVPTPKKLDRLYAKLVWSGKKGNSMKLEMDKDVYTSWFSNFEKADRPVLELDAEGEPPVFLAIAVMMSGYAAEALVVFLVKLAFSDKGNDRNTQPTHGIGMRLVGELAFMERRGGSDGQQNVSSGSETPASV